MQLWSDRGTGFIEGDSSATPTKRAILQQDFEACEDQTARLRVGLTPLQTRRVKVVFGLRTLGQGTASESGCTGCG